MLLSKVPKTVGLLRKPVNNRLSPFLINFRNLFIQTADTPNDNALKFLPSMPILGENQTKEFLSGREAACSPLALRLFSIDGIKSVMFGPNFITVEKVNLDLHWTILKPEIFSILTEFLTNGQQIISDEAASTLSSDMAINEDDDELISAIKELIFTRIRPAIQDDGGDIEFVDFLQDGTVLLKLKGACRTCDSSSVTLKNGIESMLKFYIEEVKNVEQVEDDYVIDPNLSFKSDENSLEVSTNSDGNLTTQHFETAVLKPVKREDNEPPNL